MRLKVLLISIIISSFCKAENDHLTPADNIFSLFDYQFEYYSQVRTILFKDLSDKPDVRFICIPSFTPEKILDIQENEGKFVIIYRIAKNHIWGSKNWQDISVTEYKKEIDIKSAQLIKALFLKATTKTRYYKKDIMGLDGADYYFFAWDYGLKSGTVWSPSTDMPKMKKLVEIGEKLIQLAKNDKNYISFDSAFIKEIEELTKKIEEEKDI